MTTNIVKLQMNAAMTARMSFANKSFTEEELLTACKSLGHCQKDIDSRFFVDKIIQPLISQKMIALAGARKENGRLKKVYSSFLG